MPWREFPEQKVDEPRWWEGGSDQEAAVRRGPLPSVEALTDEVVGLMFEGEGLAYARAREYAAWKLEFAQWAATSAFLDRWIAAYIPDDPPPRPAWWARSIGWAIAAWCAVNRG